jgi:hypothetical protein
VFGNECPLSERSSEVARCFVASDDSPMPGGIEPRTPLFRLSLLSKVLALVLGVAAVLLRHGIGFVLVAFALGVALIPLVFRRKAAIAGGATYAASADRLVWEGARVRRFPGELSFTPRALVWTPSGFSQSHGVKPVVIDARECRTVRAERGKALLDVILSVGSSNGEEVRFLTHTRRGLRRAIARLEESAAGAS